MVAAAAARVANKLRSVKSFDQIPRAKGFMNRFLPVPLDFIRHGGPPYMHRHIDERHKQLGPIFREKMGPYELVSVTDTSMIRHVIKNEGKYPETKLPPAWSLYMKLYSLDRGLFFQKGDKWLMTRRALDKILLDSRKVDRFGKASWLIAEDLLRNWTRTQGSRSLSESIELQDFALDLSKWSMENIAFILFGCRLGCLGKSDSNNGVRLVLQANNMLELSNRLQVLPVEFMHKINAKIWCQFKDSMQDLMQIARSISEAAMTKVSDEDHDSHVGLAHDIMSTSGLDREEIIKNMIDFLVAAADTSAASVTWALYLLAKNSKIQTRIREEIKRNLKESDSQIIDDTQLWMRLNLKLKYLDGFVRETMRLYPPAPFISRQLTSDLVIGSYQVPAGVHVIFPLITTGRMDTNFEHPMEVKPERWTSNQQSTKSIELCQQDQKRPRANKMGSLPFGLGLRMCIGRKMANLEIKMLLACILNQYEVKLSDETRLVDIKLRMTTWPDEPIKLNLIPMKN